MEASTSYENAGLIECQDIFTHNVSSKLFLTARTESRWHRLNTGHQT
jgi:hypothetical protein